MTTSRLKYVGDDGNDYIVVVESTWIQTVNKPTLHKKLSLDGDEALQKHPTEPNVLVIPSTGVNIKPMV